LNKSDVLKRLVNVAGGEAVAAGFSEVTPAHLLIALSRLSEDESGDGGGEHAQQLRQEFEALGIEPRRFRRRIRALLPKPGDTPAPKSPRRSESTKAVLLLAEALASSEEESSAHLLRALFLFLADFATQAGGGPGLAGRAADEVPYEL
jgi:hypothetical protein